MIDIGREILWDGIYAQILIYTVVKCHSVPPNPSFEFPGVSIEKVYKPYELLRDEEDHRYKDYKFFVSEVRLKALPIDLASYLKNCLVHAVSNQGEFSWLMFDGNFSFDLLLASEVCDKIYGFCWHGEAPAVETALNEIRSARWRDLVEQQRTRLETMN